ncbi:hypothetical protein GF352_04855 [archaeon]|nr:hypothetical protein [archaeon]
MNRRDLLLLLIGVVAALAVLLLFFLLQGPTYTGVLARSRALISASTNQSIDYDVLLTGVVNGLFVNSSGVASYNKLGTDALWVNDVGVVSDSIYDLRPELLVDLMLENISSISRYGKVLATDEGASCYLLEELIVEDPGYDVLMDSFEEAKLMACFSWVTGYPVYYTLLVTGSETIFINYKTSIERLTGPPPELNNTET